MEGIGHGAIQRLLTAKTFSDRWSGSRREHNRLDEGIPAPGPDDWGDSHERVRLVRCLGTTEPWSGPVLWPAGRQPDRVCRPRGGERVARLAQTTCRGGVVSALRPIGRPFPRLALYLPLPQFVPCTLCLHPFFLVSHPRTHTGIGPIDASPQKTQRY